MYGVIRSMWNRFFWSGQSRKKARVVIITQVYGITDFLLLELVQNILWSSYDNIDLVFLPISNESYHHFSICHLSCPTWQSSMSQHPEMEEIYVASYYFINRTLLPTLMTARLTNQEGVVTWGKDIHVLSYYFLSFLLTTHYANNCTSAKPGKGCNLRPRYTRPVEARCTSWQVQPSALITGICKTDNRFSSRVNSGQMSGKIWNQELLKMATFCTRGD